MSDDLKRDRRCFFRSLGRYLAAGAVTLGVGSLVARPGETCTQQGVCRGCRALDECHLPQALSLKRHLAEQDGLTDCERPAD